jgi:hypothetical protein
MKIYGPYTRKDGRQHICIVHDDGSRQTKSYPRYLLEQHLGRELLSTEHVDHINNDFTDNRIENLQILSQAENNTKAAALRPRKIYKFVCSNCGKEAERYLNHVKNNWSKHKKGPYCSRKCAGQATYVNPYAPMNR